MSVNGVVSHRCCCSAAVVAVVVLAALVFMVVVVVGGGLGTVLSWLLSLLLWSSWLSLVLLSL